MAESAPAAICASYEVPVAYLTSAALLRVFISWAFPTHSEKRVVAAAAAASDNSIDGGGGVALAEEPDLGSHTASVAFIVGKWFNPSENLFFPL